MAQHRTNPQAAGTAQDARKARLAAALRDNLARRKAQARARRGGAADETGDLLQKPPHIPVENDLS